MSEYQVYNILDLIDAIGEDEVKDILSDFSCEKNVEIREFVNNHALDFARKKLSITYLVMDDNGLLVGIFALTHKVIQIHNSLLSKRMISKIERYSTLDEDSDTYTLSAFLIAQFGKNDQHNVERGNISGDKLMQLTFGALLDAQRRVGGGVVYLEAENREKLIAFYSKECHRFTKFGERVSKRDDTNYIQMLKLF